MRTETTTALVIALACTGGVALAIQNLLLSAMVARGSSHITALAVNSALGILLLVIVNFALFGPGITTHIARVWEWWFVLPGILGTYAVFAVLYGWTHVGAAVPTVSLIAAQIVAAALIDQLLRPASARPLEPLGWVGIVLVVAGAALVMTQRGQP